MSPPGTGQADALSRGQIKVRAITAGKWALVGEVAARVAQPAVLIILARILTPADFGIVTAATIIVSFAQAFWEAGLARALIQGDANAEETNVLANVVFWINLSFALVSYAVACLAADWLAGVFGDVRIASLIRVQGLSVPLFACSSVISALLQRDMRFRPIVASRVAAAVMPGIVGIPSALLGAGYWALVAGSLAGTLIQVICLFALSDWRPARPGSWQPARRLLRFGLWSAGETSLSWAMLWLDALVIGLFFTSHELGVFRTASMIAAMTFGLPLGPLMPVLFAAMARLQTDSVQLRQAYYSAVKGIALTSSFLMALFIATPVELGAMLLGEPWRELGAIVQLLAISYAISWLVAPNAELHRANGRPDLNLKMIAGCLIAYLPLFLWGAQSGMTTFLWIRIFTACIGIAVHLSVARRAARLSPIDFGRAAGSFFCGGLVAGSVGYGVQGFLPEGEWKSIMISLAACVAIFLLVAAFERRFVFQLMRTLWHRQA